MWRVGCSSLTLVMPWLERLYQWQTDRRKGRALPEKLEHNEKYGTRPIPLITLG